MPLFPALIAGTLTRCYLGRFLRKKPCVATSAGTGTPPYIYRKALPMELLFARFTRGRSPSRVRFAREHLALAHTAHPRTMPTMRLLIALHASVAVLGNFEQAD